MRAVIEKPPVRLCCGERHWGVVCPDGKVLCGICFGRFGLDELMVDADGQKWDVCKGCEDQALWPGSSEEERRATIEAWIFKNVVITTTPATNDDALN